MLRTLLTALAGGLCATAVAARDFPQTFDHRFGTTVLTEKPLRVVSLSYQNHDNLPAPGLVPVALRDWYGADPIGVWPLVVLKGKINIGQIAALTPDEIALSSEIAPDIPPAAPTPSMR